MMAIVGRTPHSRWPAFWMSVLLLVALGGTTRGYSYLQHSLSGGLKAKSLFESSEEEITERAQSDQQRGGRMKRDLEEIIRNKPIMYAPIIMEKINNSLIALQIQMTLLEYSLLNPSNITEPTTSSISLSTPFPANDTSSLVNSFLAPALTSTTTTASILKETSIYREFGMAPQAWSKSKLNPNELLFFEKRQDLPTAPNLNGTMDLDENITTPLPPTNIATSLLLANDTGFSQTNSTTTAPLNLNTTTTLAPETNTTVTETPTNTTATTVTPQNVTEAPLIPTAADIAGALYTVLNSSEMIMINILSKDRVTELEDCLKILTLANKYIWKIDLQNATETLLYWMALAKLSTKHGLQRLEEQRLTFIYIEKLDDITSLITAGFCILAIIFTVYMCYLSSRRHKPYIVSDYPPYNNEPSYRIRNNNNSSTPPSVALRPSRNNSDLYSVPSGPTTRSNPLYSSQRSVDVDQPQVDTVPAMHAISNDSPRADSARYDPSAERIGRDTNLQREKRFPHQPGIDYRDPRRNRRSNLDQYRDNPAFIGDDGNPVRVNNSESAF